MPYLVGYLSWRLAYKYIGFGVSCYAVISYAANPHLIVLISYFAGNKWVTVANGILSFCFQMASLFVPLFLAFVYDFKKRYLLLWVLIAIGPIFVAFCLYFIKIKKTILLVIKYFTYKNIFTSY